MAEANCSHTLRISGVLQCDLSRTSDKRSVHSARLTVRICEECGEVQLYCEDHKTISDWLVAGKKEGNG